MKFYSQEDVLATVAKYETTKDALKALHEIEEWDYCLCKECKFWEGSFTDGVIEDEAACLWRSHYVTNSIGDTMLVQHLTKPDDTCDNAVYADDLDENFG